MKRMYSVSDFAARWLRLGLALASIAFPWNPAVAQTTSPRNAPAKSPATSSQQVKEDPLAPLLKQAADAIDKMEYAAAVDPLQKYIAQRPDEAYPHFQLGYAYVGLKRDDDAKGEFSRAVALDPKMAAAYQNLGLLLMDNDPGAAADAFRHQAELRPTESRPRFLAGFSFEHAGKMPEAIEQYQAALALSPKDYEAQFALGRVLLRSNHAAGAETHFRAALELRGDAAPAQLGLASALLAQEKYEGASDELADYLKSSPGDRFAHFDRAEALLHLGHLDDALEELDHSGAAAPLAAEVSKMRGEIYIQQKKWKEAEVSLKQAISLSPQDPELPEWLGHTEIELRDYPTAIRILQPLNSRNPEATDTLADLANAFYLNENYGPALDAMDRLARLETPKSGSWFVRAICYDKLSRQAEAIEAYQKFLDQDGGQHDTQDFQARQRILFLQKELAKSKKK